MKNELVGLRNRYAALLVWLFWLHVPLAGLVSLWIQALPFATAVLTASVPAALYHMTYRRCGVAPATCYVGTVALISEPALLLVLFSGHPWQMDMHMYFFALMALNIAWFRTTPLYLGAALTSLHHLVLLYLLPSAVFPGQGDLARVLLHAVIVAFQTIVLLWVVTKLRETFWRIGRMGDELLKKGVALEERTREAEAANQAKSMFLANVSHEIRTPINAILGFSHLLQRTALKPSQKDQIGKINSAGVTLLRLINDVLDVSKIEAGKFELDECEFDLRTAIESQLQMVSESALSKGLSVDVQVAKNIPTLLIGDDMRFNQVVLNLLSNAIKFTPQGRISVTVEKVAEADGIADIQCSVKDSGIGMTPEQQAVLFKSFAQADPSTTRRFGGTGLGLAISRQIAEQMGGWIKVDSVADQGSTFTFLVRMRLGGQLPYVATGPDGSLRRLRILVGDDNPAARQIIQEIFARWGMQADLAVSGQSVLDMVQTAAADGKSYDLLMLDWKMPVIDGMDALKRMKGLPGLSKLPVTVMMTAYDLDDCIQLGAGQDIAAFLSKPIDAARLSSTLNHLFQVATTDDDTQIVDGSGRPGFGYVDQLPRQLHGLRVLLAEDNEINREIAVELLTDAGLVVECASNGRLACEMVESRGDDFAAILMDVQMPEMDGVTATVRIRETVSSEALPIIAMTAHAYEEDRQRCLGAGMNDHIAKPIDPQLLIATLTQWLSAAEANGAPAQIRSRPDGHANEELPAQLPPFDIETALARVNGRKPLLRRLIVSFHDNYSDCVDRLAAKIHQGKHGEAADLAHSLKGVAASLELADVVAPAQAIEDLLRSGHQTGFDDLMAELRVAVQSAVNAAASLIPDRSAPARMPDQAAEVTDITAAMTARDDLRDKLGRQSLSARRAYGTFADALGLTPEQREQDPMGEALLRLDYDEALELLDAHYADLANDRKDKSA
ncbi:hybrid sensor histidine kinase/response regulator [Paracoccus tegillarcae]|uniref:histidine kinase n=1 Tax=Paracoccus tegillarcae TaxID=1529068 RepID=A0A2K9EZS4_9RHOB|nr:hybrid sensor histidine kinase/response regulator [Paracoccus tegillarcae]AUH34814.1 hybrid sensor histidine kinase/response regulator [Paracoccus tegillarcae]